MDYARGDGVAIGPGHEREWSPVVIDDETRWVRDYRGLWGLDTRDRFGGERAPSGPRNERNGSVRTSWANPLGWAGLLKVPPEDDDQQLGEALQGRLAALDEELSELDSVIGAEQASVIVVLTISPLAFFTTIAALFLIFSGVEAIARRRLLSFLASTALLLVGIALLAGLILLLLNHWRTAIAVLVGIAALALLAANFQELRRR